MKKPPRMPRIGKIQTTAAKGVTSKRRPSSTPPLKGSPPARSPSVASSSYSPETGHLTVTYRGGRTYRYAGLEPEKYKDFCDCDSQGRWLHEHVIGKLDHERVED